ncbi:MAG: 6-phosphogluconolactonase [Kineosporiaceae bacterium]
MSAPATVVVHADAALLAEAAAARLVTRIVDAQAAQGLAQIVLTGGGVGTATLKALAATPARDAVDWAAVEVWWGDERFLPPGHADRNETQAREALLDHVPLDPARVHPMPAVRDPWGDDVDAAAAAYADELRAAAPPWERTGVPAFDVLLLGVGPDGHVASLFPEHPALYETERTVVGVRGSPKPPPVRTSLTMPVIRTASEVWLLAAGAEKAAAVAMALSSAGEVAVPAAGAQGTRATLWLLDRAAAAKVPPALTRISSP